MGGHPQHVCSRVGGRGRHRALRCHGVAVRARRRVRAVPDLRQRALALRTAPRSHRSRLPAHVRRPDARSKDAAVTARVRRQGAAARLAWADGAVAAARDREGVWFAGDPRGPRFRRRGGRPCGRDRAQRRRQVDDDAHPRGPRGAGRGRVDAAARARRRLSAAAGRGRRAHDDRAGARRAAGPRRARPRARARRRAARRARPATSTGWRGFFASRRSWSTVGQLRAARASMAARAHSCSSSAWRRTISSGRPTSCPAVSGSSRRSPRASCRTPTCCSSTSRRRTSTSQRASGWSR